jgi:hypothetical protein
MSRESPAAFCVTSWCKGDANRSFVVRKPGRQFLPRRALEQRLIGFAYAFEQATRHRLPPESTPPLPTDTARE